MNFLRKWRHAAVLCSTAAVASGCGGDSGGGSVVFGGDGATVSFETPVNLVGYDANEFGTLRGRGEFDVDHSCDGVDTPTNFTMVELAGNGVSSWVVSTSAEVSNVQAQIACAEAAGPAVLPAVTITWCREIDANNVSGSVCVGNEHEVGSTMIPDITNSNTGTIISDFNVDTDNDRAMDITDLQISSPPSSSSLAFPGEFTIDYAQDDMSSSYRLSWSEATGGQPPYTYEITWTPDDTGGGLTLPLMGLQSASHTAAESDFQFTLDTEYTFSITVTDSAGIPVDAPPIMLTPNMQVDEPISAVFTTEPPNEPVIAQEVNSPDASTDCSSLQIRIQNTLNEPVERVEWVVFATGDGTFSPVPDGMTGRGSLDDVSADADGVSATDIRPNPGVFIPGRSVMINVIFVDSSVTALVPVIACTLN